MGKLLTVINEAARMVMTAKTGTVGSSPNQEYWLVEGPGINPNHKKSLSSALSIHDSNRENVKVVAGRLRRSSVGNGLVLTPRKWRRFETRYRRKKFVCFSARPCGGRKRPWGILREKENASSFNLSPLIKPSRFPGQRSTSPCLPPDIDTRGLAWLRHEFFEGQVRKNFRR